MSQISSASITRSSLSLSGFATEYCINFPSLHILPSSLFLIPWKYNTVKNIYYNVDPIHLLLVCLSVSYMLRTVPLSIIRSFSLYTQQCFMSYRFPDSLRAGSGGFRPGPARSCQQTYMGYTIAVCTVKNSWLWTEELSETCRVLFKT